MTTGKAVAIREDKAVAIYELETRFAMAVRQRELLEDYIKERLKPDKHFYTVEDDPGRKPSLTKEGAELICLPHALKAHYHLMSGPENPPTDDTPFQITMKCELEANGNFAGEGVGSASSHQTTKSGEYKPRQRDPGLRHNATIKMACKSSYIAATLNSTAASEFFTQDLEDDQTGSHEKSDKKEHWCEKHKVNFFKRGKMKSYAHPIGDTDEWCHEYKEEVVVEGEKSIPAEPPKTTETHQDAKPVNEKAKRDSSTIKNFTDLYKACISDWPETFKSSKDVVKELGYSSQTDITITPAECYQQIADSRK